MFTPKEVDLLFEKTGEFGGLTKNITNLHYGFNHRKQPLAIQPNQINQGFVMITRPACNMQDMNLQHATDLTGMLNTKSDSISKFVRLTLDPDLSKRNSINVKNKKPGPALKTDLVDPKTAFIPLVTNTIKTLSGWPVATLPTWTSPSGVRGEQYSMIDGVLSTLGTFELDMTLTTIREHSTTLLFQTWAQYPGLALEGILSPYMKWIGEGNTRDSDTGIYRIILNTNLTHVIMIAKTIGKPIIDPSSAFFNFNTEEVYAENTKEISIRFQCDGFEYNNAKIIQSFNETVGIFHNEMFKLNEAGSSETMTQVPKKLLDLINYRGYPRIDPNTLEFQWWIDKDIFNYKRIPDGN